MVLPEKLEQHRKFLNADSQVLNNAAQRFTILFSFVNRDDHSCLIAFTHIDSLASALSPENESQSLGDADQVLRG